MKAKNININKVMANVCIEVKITGISRYKFKLWLAKNIFRSVAWILRCKIEVKYK